MEKPIEKQEVKQMPIVPEKDQQGQLIGMGQFLSSPAMRDYLSRILGRRTGTFTSTLVALVTSNTQLAECSRISLLGCALRAVGLGLTIDPNFGYAGAVPYKNSKSGVTEAQFQIMTNGYKQLAVRSGNFEYINSTDVREGEIKSYDRTSDIYEFEWIDQNPTEENREKRSKAKIIGYLAEFKDKSGFRKQLYMTVGEIEAHAIKYSQSYRYYLAKKKKGEYVKDEDYHWAGNKDGMSNKTVLKLLLKRWGRLTIELEEAIDYDGAVFDNKGEVTYKDNPGNTEEIEFISMEQQRELLTTYTNETINKALQEANFEGLSKIPEGAFETFKIACEAVAQAGAIATTFESDVPLPWEAQEGEETSGKRKTK